MREQFFNHNSRNSIINLRLSQKKRSLEPFKLKDHTDKPKNLSNKIEFITKSCDNFKKQINSASKSIIDVFANSIKQTYIDTEGDEANTDKNWKKKFAMLKEAKMKENIVYKKLKSLTNPEIISKAPIKRQPGRTNLNAPERSRISVSDISSSTGKLILSENKRKFGELASSNLYSQPKNESQKVLHFINTPSSNKNQDYSKKPFKEFCMYRKTKDIPGLALSIRNITRNKRVVK